MIHPMRGLLDLLFPPRCPFCHHFWSQPDTDYCPSCQQNLPWAFGGTAVQAGAVYTLCLSPLLYQGDVRTSFHRYKFTGRKHYAQVYGKLMAQCVRDQLTEPWDLLTWAPLSPKRKRKRGYDQAFLLAEVLGTQLGISPVVTLEKAKHRPAQSGLGHEDDARRANVKGAYRLKQGADVAGRSILLVDDIVTTGSTLSECAQVLLEAGAEQVFCVTLARARMG